MLVAAKIIAIVGALVGLIGGIVGGEEWLGLGGLLLVVALALILVRMLSREPPTIVEMLEATDGAEQSTTTRARDEPKIIDTSRELKREV